LSPKIISVLLYLERKRKRKRKVVLVWDTTTEDVINKASSTAGAVDFILAFFSLFSLDSSQETCSRWKYFASCCNGLQQFSTVLEVPQSAVVLRWWWYVKS
jgi:hypothetical protein